MVLPDVRDMYGRESKGIARECVWCELPLLRSTLYDLRG